MRSNIILIFVGVALAAAARDSLPLLNVEKSPAGGIEALPPQFAGLLDEQNKADELFPVDQSQSLNDGESPSLAKIFALNRDNDNLPASLSETAIVEAANGIPHGQRNISAFVKPDEDVCLPKVDLVFLLDTSGSIEQLYQEHVRWAVALVESLPIEEETVRVAAVQYAGFPLTEFALGTYPNANDIRRHLAKISAQSGVTRTGYALRKAEAELFREERGARSDAKKVIVLFTDGLSIDDPLKPAQQLRDLKGVTIYVVSVGKDGAGFAHEMNRIAGTRENVFGPEDLPRLREALIAEAERARACTRVGAAKSNDFAEKSPAFRIATTGAVTVVTTVPSSAVIIPLSPATALAQSSSQHNITSSPTETFIAATTAIISSLSFIKSESTSVVGAVEDSAPSDIVPPPAPLEDELAELAPLSDIAEDILLLNALNEERGTAQRAVITARHGAPNNNDAVVSVSAADETDKGDISTIIVAEDVATVTTVATSISTVSSHESVVTEVSTIRNDISNRAQNIDAGETNSSAAQNVANDSGKVDTAAHASRVETITSSERTAATTKPRNILKSVHTVAEIPKIASLDNSTGETFDVFEMSDAAGQTHAKFTPALRVAVNASTTTRHQLSRVTFETARAATIIPLATVARRPSFTVDVAANRGVFTPRILASGTATPKRNPLKAEKAKSSSEHKASQNSSTTERQLTPTNQSWRFRQTSTVSSSSAAPTTTTHRRFTTTTPSTSATVAARTPTTRRPARISATPQTPSAPSRPARLQSAQFGCAADWLFVVDSSGSVQKVYDAQKEYLNDILDQVQLHDDLTGHRVALLQFAGSDIQKMEWFYDDYRSHDSLMNAFHQIRHITGTTYIGAALNAAAQVLETRRRQVPGVVVLLSDGFSQDDVAQAAAAIRRQSNVEIYALSIADLNNTKLLTSITSQPENAFVGGNGAAALRKILTDRLKCSQRRTH